GLQLKINVTQGGNTEDRILNLEKKQTTPFVPAEQLEFEAYKKYDINVGVGKKWTYHLEVSAPSISVPFTGGSISGWVRSYKTDGGTPEPAPWRVEGYSETGASGPFTSTPPTWLTGFTPNGNGVASSSGTEAITANVSISSIVINNNTRTIALQGKSEVGSQADPIDLSKVPAGTSPLFSIDDGATASTYASKPMNTANCYVVTRPGWYKIPVVYGNAIKNNIDNTSAYTSSASGVNVLQNFIRHDGNTITKPWIKENGINLDNGIAEPVWQDWPFLVQSIQLQPDKRYIVFYIDKKRIHEGNAVIALKESATGDIVWSWHIWVYGGDDLKSINVKNNKAKAPTSKPGQDNFNFLSESLGACDNRGEKVSYPIGNVWVKISNGRKTTVIQITRNGFSLNPGYNSPYYQWGRKDPMLPSDGTTLNQNKVWFDKDNTILSSPFPTANWSSDGTPNGANAEIANTIKNPHTSNTSFGMDNLYYNLWDTSCNETSGNLINTARFLPAIKSVYDPCPPGFCLPPNGAFTGFTRSGNNSNIPSEWNVSGNFNNGWHFRTVLKGESGGETIFFPALGYCTPNGNVTDAGRRGLYWLSVSYNTDYGDYFDLLPASVCPLFSEPRFFGHAIRPVKEN
ncbi:MAG: hypothetical protein ACTTK1_06425, partial [Candidatus Cryptobacteroides sp.]